MNIARRRLLLAPAIAAFAAPKRPVPLLVVDGINNHDWQAGTRFIRSVLENDGRFSVDVSTTPAADAPRADWNRWRPDFSRYAGVISNFNGGHTADGIRWPPAVEESLDKFVSGGGGLVVFHAANNAFLEWADYNEMIGLGWRDKSFGPGLVVDAHERVQVIPAGEGLDPGHGPRHDFEITVMDPRHPITRSLPKRWIHPSEQLTHGQHAPANPKHGAPEKELRILTYAWSKDSQRREPLDWVRNWRKGRIYVTMLGHTWKDEDNPNLKDLNFRALFVAGVAWIARVEA